MHTEEVELEFCSSPFCILAWAAYKGFPSLPVRSKLPLDPVILARAIGASGLIYIVRYGLQKQALL
jgi:hypothetical protein